MATSASNPRPSRIEIQNRARRALAESRQRRGGAEFWKPRDCTDPDERPSRIRMVFPPYLDERRDDPWERFQAYGFKRGKEFYSSGAPSFYDLPDPVADLRDSLAGNKAELKKIPYPSEKYLALIIDRDEPGKGLQVWQFGVMVADELLGYIGNEDWNLFWDAQEGHDIEVRRSGEGLETSYDIKLRRKESPLADSPEAIETLLVKASKLDLRRYITVDTPETLEELLEGGDIDRELFKERRQARDAATGRVPKLHLSGEGDDSDEDAKPYAAAPAARAGAKAAASAPKKPAATKPTPAPSRPARQAEESEDDDLPFDSKPAAPAPPAQKSVAKLSGSVAPAAKRARVDDEPEAAAADPRDAWIGRRVTWSNRMGEVFDGVVFDKAENPAEVAVRGDDKREWDLPMAKLTFAAGAETKAAGAAKRGAVAKKAAVASAPRQPDPPPPAPVEEDESADEPEADHDNDVLDAETTDAAGDDDETDGEPASASARKGSSLSRLREKAEKREAAAAKKPAR